MFLVPSKSRRRLTAQDSSRHERTSRLEPSSLTREADGRQAFRLTEFGATPRLVGHTI